MVNASVVCQDRAGLAIRILERGGRPTHWSAIARGAVITPKMLTYLEEIAAVHAFLVLREGKAGVNFADFERQRSRRRQD